MNGVYSKTTFYQHVEFSGHLLDSLTLSKVIDRIQQAGCDYHINDIRIGSQKHDISSINLTLYAPDEARLHTLMEALTPYGAVPVEHQSVATSKLTVTDVPPANAFTIRFPKRIRFQDRWLEVDARAPMVITVDETRQTARLTPISEVAVGTDLVAGAQGIEW